MSIPVTSLRIESVFRKRPTTLVRRLIWVWSQISGHRAKPKAKKPDSISVQESYSGKSTSYGTTTCSIHFLFLP